MKARLALALPTRFASHRQALVTFCEAHRIACLAGLSLAVSLVIPATATTRYGDLSNNFTDHLHHSFATWLFFKHGFALYTRPFADLWANTDFPQPMRIWGQMPMVYPPGVFVVFLPLTLLGRYLPMSQRVFGAIGVAYLVVLAHLALAALWRALTLVPPGARLFFGIAAWLALGRLSLEGFYDPLWIGCGAMMVVALRGGRPERALYWYALAAFLHLRSVMLVPLAAYAALDVRRTRGVLAPWPFVAAGASSLIAVATFAVTYPVAAAYQLTKQPSALSLANGLFWVVLGVCAAMVIVAELAQDHLLAATVLLGSLLAFIDFKGYLGYWHHASLTLVAPLAVGLVKRARHPALVRQATLAWAFALYAVVWKGSPFDLLVQLAKRHWA